jgi:hypothetical protein
VTEKYEVVGETVLDGTRCYKVAARITGLKYTRYTMNEAVLLLAVTPDGYLDLGHEWVNEGKQYRWQKVPGFCVLKPDQAGPATWDAKWKEYALWDKERDDTKGPYAKRSVPQAPDKVTIAGRLVEAIRVESRYDAGDFVSLQTTWYARGVGPVKYRSGKEGENKYVDDVEAPAPPEK